MALIPMEVAAPIGRFLESAKTGTIQLDVKDGRVLNVRLTESVRIDAPKRTR